MLSLFENTSADVTVHILHDNTLTQDNRDKFIYLAGQYNQRVKFYNVEDLCANELAEFKRLIPDLRNSWVTVGGFFKFLILKVVPTETEKIIYLDSDIVVNLDIKELWQIRLGEYPLAAVPEALNGVDPYRTFPIVIEGRVKPEDYFNSGVMLLNLNIFRREELTLLKGMKFVAANPQYHFFDQDVLNYCFSTAALKLPIKFNLLVRDLRARPGVRVERKIYHYAAASIRLERDDIFNRLWLSYFMKTPWFDEEAIGRLYAGFRQVHVGLKQSLVNLSAILSGRTRAFFAAPKDLDGLRQFFSIRDDEKIIPADGQDAFQKLLDTMRKARGKRVFFIMVPYFPVQILTEAGFLPGKDFVNGLEFLFDVQGGSLNSYELIKAM